MESEQVFDLENIPKTYISIAIPVVVNMLVTLVYNLADTYFISQTQNADLVAGVSICGPVFTLLMAFGNIYGQGGSSLISRLLGEKNEDGIKKVSSFCFYIAIITGVVLGILMVIFQNPLLMILGADSDTLEYAREYFLVLAVGAPITVLSFIHSNLLRCEGLVSEAVKRTIAGTVVNIILDPIFISVFGWGAFGAALATIIGYAVSVVLLFVMTIKKSRYLSVDPRIMKIDRGWMGQIMSIGLTAAITNICQSVAMVLVNQMLKPYGSERIAAMGIVLKVAMVGQLILVGLSFGGVPLYGYLYGAGNKGKLKELIGFARKLLLAVGAAFAVILFIGAPWILPLFLDTGSVVANGIVMLRLQVIAFPFVAIVLQMTVIFQASGLAKEALIMSLSRQGVLFVIVLLLADMLFGYYGVLASQAVADVISAGLALILYRKVFK